MTFQISFFLQISAILTSVFILSKNKRRILSLIPFSLVTLSFIFKPHLVKDNLNLVIFFEERAGIEDDPKYLLISSLFKIFGTNWLIFFILQLTAAFIVFYLFYISLPEELLKDKISGFKKSIQIPHFIFFIFNYIFIGLGNLSVNHPRQFLSSLVLIYCFFQVTISEKKSQNIKFKTLIISLLATLIHISGALSTIYIFYLYFKNNQFLGLSRIKTLSLKDTLFQRYINLFLAISIIILLYFSIKLLYVFGITFASNFIGIGAYITEVDYYDRNLIGFLLPIINIIPLIIYTSIWPFNNFFKKIPNKNNLKRYYQTLNLYTFCSISVIILEYSINFYSIGRLKTLLIPLLFFLIFQTPESNKSTFFRRSALVVTYFLACISVYRAYSNVI